MSVPPAIRRKHEFVTPYVQEVAGRVRDVVSRCCEDLGHAYLGRVKTAESLAEKIETGRFARWSDIDDLFACCVVIPTLADEEAVLDRLRSAFVEVAIRARHSTRKDPEVFRFDATRFIGRLSPTLVPDESVDILSISFEVQIRTAFEHAWSVTTHALAYKSPQIDWRYLRLATQLRAVIEQLDQLVDGFEKTALFITEQNWPEVQARQMIAEYFGERFKNGSLPSEVRPVSWSRFSENLQRVCRSYSDRRSRDILGCSQRAIQVIDNEVQKAERDEFPRSISLLQFCLGALAAGGFATRASERYTPLITQELIDLYPKVRSIGRSFDLEK